MPAGTIALTNNSTTVTGTGTSFTTELKVGDFIGVIVGSAPYTAVVAAIASNTSLTMTVPFNGPTSSGLAWNAVPASLKIAITQQVLNDMGTVARGMILEKANWQKIFSSDTSVTVTMPDLTQFTGPSWGYIASIAGNSLQLPTANSSGDLGSLTKPGVYSIPSSMTGQPVSSNGVLMVTAIASGNSVVQDFTCTSTSASNYGRVFRRVGTISSGVTTWTDWTSQNLWHIEASSVDLNLYIRPGTYAGGSFVNGPAAMGTAVGFMTVLANVSATNITQQITYVASGRTWTRTCSGGTWTAWAESLTTNSFGTTAGTAAQGNDSRFNTVNGKSGGTISSAITLPNGVSWSNTPASSTEDNSISAVNTSTGIPTSQFVNYIQYNWYADRVFAGVRRGSGVTIDRYSITISGVTEFQFTRAGNGICSGTWSGGSDERHKSNIKEVPDALAAVLSWRGATYDKKDGANEVGLIAQDVERACASAVITAGNRKFSDNSVVPDFKYLNTAGAAAAFHTEAIKSLFALVELAITEPETALKHLDEIKQKSLKIAQVEISNDAVYTDTSDLDTTGLLPIPEPQDKGEEE